MKRPRRNRRSTAIRSLVQETALSPADLVAPLFVVPGQKRKEELEKLPQVFRYSVDELVREAEALHRKGLPAVALFPIIEPEKKDPTGQESLNEKGIIPEAIRILKKELPSLCVISDIALDPFTSHGHDGVIGENNEVHNDRSVELLSRMALLHAHCGVDFVAPSDMMDGRVRAIRKLLDSHEKQDTGILSYTAKFASSLYGPFRDTLRSKPAFGDKRGYQMNPANIREALLEATLDAEEGADILMVKPGLFYLDVISKIKDALHLPVCAYHVSGEYAMVIAAHDRGYLDATAVFLESLLCLKRAGADFIFTYAAPLILDHLQKKA